MDCPDVIGKGSLDGNPPLVSLYLHVHGNCVADATFQAEGCGVTIACGSMLTELLKDRSHFECRQISAETLDNALDGIPIGKEYCVAVAISALRDAIRNWDSSGLATEQSLKDL
jgi:NifU-like protein involved in Fe-S cluster formation